MKKAILILGIFYFSFFSLFSQVISPTHIYFTSGSDQLTLESKQILDLFCKNLDFNSPDFLEIVGHTDDVGEDRANIDLALRRAEQTKAYIMAQGFEKKQILVAALGESQPLASNEKESGRKLNRRVSFTLGDGTFAWVKAESSLIYQEKEQLGVLKEQTDEDLSPREKQFAELLHSLQKPGQKFFINTRRESRIQSKNGTLIYVPRGVLETEDGSTMTDEVHVILNEYYSRSDMILGNLNSMSPNGLLESGGMLEIQAYSGNKRLKLKEGRKLEVYIPTEKVQEGMELFTSNSPNTDEIDPDIWNLDTTWSNPDPSRIDSVRNLWYVNKEETRRWKEVLGDPNLLSIGGDTVWQNRIPVIINQKAAIRRPRVIPSIISTSSNIEYYLLNVADLGWINCDRFRYDRRPKTSLLVKRDTDQPMIIKLIFKDMNALMSGTNLVNGYIQFPRLPIGQKVLVIAIAKGEGENQFEFGLQEVEIEKKLKIDNIALNEGSFEDMTNMLRTLN